MGKNMNDEQEKNLPVTNDETEALDDERRVKVLSPMRLVVKRFFRNQLSVAGLILLGIMVLFSFVGQFLSSYKQAEQFYKYTPFEKDYAAATKNERQRAYAMEGTISPALESAFRLAIATGDEEFTAAEVDYTLTRVGENLSEVYVHEVISEVTVPPNKKLKPIFNPELDADVTAAFNEAMSAKETKFTVGEVDYYIARGGADYTVSTLSIVALGDIFAYDMYTREDEPTPAFRLAAGRAIASGENGFEVDGNAYTLAFDDDADMYVVYKGGAEYANASKVVVKPYNATVNLSVSFKERVKEAIADGEARFEFAEPGSDKTDTFVMYRNDVVWDVMRIQDTKVVDAYSELSEAHPLGLDGNGMDIMTRLMYGGRISLVIGLVVVVIDLLIGVTLGGIAGYFGKWVDNLIMRLVDIMFCIPSLPLLIILGSLMDQVHVEPVMRIFYLVIILGFLSWPGTARLVRGQILSLREQEFMVATEATGLSVFRRIFRHLVPNVVPLLIVQSTMEMGGVILTESALSFLGLGVKFPFASWGNIISAISDIYVMTHFLNLWIPAGVCILVTVLGFNFVGDGLRDAFDPKMKR